MLEFVPEYFKIREMLESAVKNHYSLKYMFVFSIRLNKCVKKYFRKSWDIVISWSVRTQKVSKTAADYDSLAWKSVRDCYKTQGMCNTGVNAYRLTLMHVPICYKTQNMWNKAANTYPFMLGCAPNCYDTHKLCEKFVSEKTCLH